MSPEQFEQQYKDAINTFLNKPHIGELILVLSKPKRRGLSNQQKILTVTTQELISYDDLDFTISVHDDTFEINHLVAIMSNELAYVFNSTQGEISRSEADKLFEKTFKIPS